MYPLLQLHSYFTPYYSSCWDLSCKHCLHQMQAIELPYSLFQPVLLAHTQNPVRSLSLAIFLEMPGVRGDRLNFELRAG